MIEIFAMGIRNELLIQLDVVTILREALPDSTKIEPIDDLDKRFGPASKDYCWRFGEGADEHINEWVAKMISDGYCFEGATLLVDEEGRVAFIEAKKEIPEEKTEEELQEEMNQVKEEAEIKAISESEISASVQLECQDENGKIARFKVRGSYKKKKHATYDGIIETIDLNMNNGLNHEDLEKLRVWVSNCEQLLMDYTIKGPAYTANQEEIQQFSVGRVAIDNLHAAILDKMIDALKEQRNSIVPLHKRSIV